MLSILRRFNRITSCLFVLQLALLSCVIVNAQDQGAEQTPAQAFDFGQGMPNGMPDMSELKGMLANFLTDPSMAGLAGEESEAEDKEIEKKQQMLEALPQETRVLYKSAEDAYVNFLRKISIKNGLQDLCGSITKKLNELSATKQNSDVTDAVNITTGLLDKFEKALFAGSFPQIPAAMPDIDFKDLLKKFAEKLQADQPVAEQTATDENVASEADKDKKEPEVPAVKFETSDFNQLFETLVKLLPVIKESEDIQLVSDVVSFKNIVITLKNENRLETMKRYFNYLSPFHKKAYELMSDLRKMFVQKVREIRKEVEDKIVAGQESASETKKLKNEGRVYIYWRKELSTSLSYLNKFESLKNSSSSIFSDKEWLFNSAGYFYDLSLSFLNCYKRSLFEKSGHEYSTSPGAAVGRFLTRVSNPNWLAVKSYEYGAAGLFAYAAYKSQSVAMARPQIISHVMNGKSFGQNKSANPLEMLMPLLSGGMQGPDQAGGPLSLLSTMSAMMGPGQEKMMNRLMYFMALMAAVSPKGLSQYGEVVSTIKDIAVAVIYDNFRANRLNVKNWKAWPNGMPALTGEVFYLGQHLTASGSELLCSEINKWFPTFWAKSSSWSFGIVSPDLVRSFMLRLFPIMVFSYNPRPGIANFHDQETLMKIANLDPNNINAVLGEVDKIPHVKDDLQDEAYKHCAENHLDADKYHLFDASVKKIGKNLGVDDSTLDRYCRFKRAGNRVVSFEWYCIESFLVSYVFSCFGSKLGQFVAKKYNKPMWGATYKVVDFALDKVLSLCNKMYLIDDEERESWNETKQEIEEMFDSVPELIDDLMKELSNPTSMIRMMMIQALVSFKMINIDGADQQSPEFQENLNAQIVYFMLSLLVNKVRVISLNDAYELMRTYVVSNKQKSTLLDYRRALAAGIKEHGKDAINIDVIKADLGSIDKALVVEFNRIFEKKDPEFDGQVYSVRILKELSYQAKTRFSKALTEKLKVSLFATAMGHAVFGPIFNQTVGNWVKDQGTVLDGVTLIGNKAGSAAGWVAGKFMSKVPGMPL